MRALIALLAFCLLCSTARAADFLPKVKRIVFLGDSITYSGEYIDRFELFLRSYYPDRHFEVIDLGLPSETVSGLSEEGHAGGKFPRPGLHERLDRVLAKAKPDLVFACYGMNDGIYLPPSPERLAKFQAGMQKLHEKVEAVGAQIIHLTPPVFDAVPLGEKVSADGLKGPFAGYDEVLTQYSLWLMSRRTAGWRVIDLHTPMLKALQERRAADPAFCFAKDGVHANGEGHAVMARALVEEFVDTPKAVSEQPLPPNPTAEDRLKAFEKYITTVRSQTTFFDPNGPALNPDPYKLITERRKLLSNAWLSECGHLRPGMGKGLPVEEATAKAKELSAKIDGMEVTAPHHQ